MCAIILNEMDFILGNILAFWVNILNAASSLSPQSLFTSTKHGMWQDNVCDKSVKVMGVSAEMS